MLIEIFSSLIRCFHDAKITILHLQSNGLGLHSIRHFSGRVYTAVAAYFGRGLHPRCRIFIRQGFTPPLPHFYSAGVYTACLQSVAPTGLGLYDYQSLSLLFLGC